MAITVEPKWQGETIRTGQQPSAQIEYLIFGTDDLNMALAALRDAVDGFIFVGALVVPLQECEVTSRLAESIYVGAAQYGYGQALEEGDETLSFSTTGGRKKVTQSLSTTKYGSEAIDFKGAIGVTENGIEGVEVPAPALQIVKTRRFAPDFVTPAYLKTLATLSGSKNDAAFMGFEAGELLFEGATGSQKRPDEPWDITFNFNASQNATGLSVDTITGIAKLGWNYLWVHYRTKETALGLAQQPRGVYVEEVSPDGDFTAIGLSGS